jgi:hypothetical protein
MVNVPVREPVVEGVKTTFTLQVASAAIELHLLDAVKSPLA